MRGHLSAALLACHLVGCDATILPNDGRREIPAETSWAIVLHAPGTAEVSVTRNINGPVMRVYVDGPAGEYDLSLALSGIPCPGPDGDDSRVNVRVDGKAGPSFRVTSTRASYVLERLAISPRPRSVDLVFPNDFGTASCDRMVTLSGVSAVRRVD